MIPIKYLYFLIITFVLVVFVVAVMMYFGGFKETANIISPFSKKFSTG